MNSTSLEIEDESSSLYSEETIKSVKFYVEGIGILIMAVIGIFINIFALSILFKKTGK